MVVSGRGVLRIAQVWHARGRASKDLWCVRYDAWVNNEGHYFSPAPGSEVHERDLTVEIDGVQRSLVTTKGLFSFDGLDKATAILLNNADMLPPIPDGARIVDVGCGWGPIALTLALRHPSATVTAVDVNPHARTINAQNAKRLGLTNIRVAAPDEVDGSDEFDALWSNPPIRIGKTALHELLKRWLGQLAPGGTAALVVGKNLGSDSLATWMQQQFPERTISKAHSSKGFRLLTVGPLENRAS